jgi:hypothetical protein
MNASTKSFHSAPALHEVFGGFDFGAALIRGVSAALAPSTLGYVPSAYGYPLTMPSLGLLPGLGVPNIGNLFGANFFGGTMFGGGYYDDFGPPGPVGYGDGFGRDFADDGYY